VSTAWCSRSKTFGKLNKTASKILTGILGPIRKILEFYRNPHDKLGDFKFAFSAKCLLYKMYTNTSVNTNFEITHCGFIFILCHKNYRKTTFNSGIPHAKFARTSRWQNADVATTSHRPVQQYAWCHWDSAMTLTQQRKSVYHICCIWYFYTTPDTTAQSPDSTGQILLVFYEIYRVGDRACSWINFARKGIIVCIF
jgi:hypothetical protein